MPLTGLSVRTSRSYYSRYEAAYSVVRATITPTPATGIDGEQVRVDLVRTRLSGPDVLATRTITFGAGAPEPAQAVSFDLAGLMRDGYMAALRSYRTGDYSVVATSLSDAAVTASARFTVTPMTPERMRREYLAGLPLTQIERQMPRQQPVNATGVTVVEVARLSLSGTGALIFTLAGKTLTWRGGAAVTLDPVAPQTYTLPEGGAGTGYLVVEVDPAILPVGNTSDTLVLDYAVMTDESIVDQMLAEWDKWEHLIGIRFEPTIIVTPRLVATEPLYDAIEDGLTYYDHHRRDEWWHVKTPWHGLKRIDAMSGWMNQTKLMDIPETWRTHIERIGFVQLVPTSGAPLMFAAPGIFPIPYSNLGQLMPVRTLPHFWQFRVLAGLDQIPPALMAHVAKRAALPILAQAAQSRFPSGTTSYSLSRDGVSESQSVQAMGIFKGAMDRYAADTGLMPDGTDTAVHKLQQLYRGILMQVL